MEDMRAVAVDLDSLYRLSIYIAADVRALVDHKNGFAGGVCLLRKGSAKQSCAHHKIIIMHGSCPLPSE